MNNLTLTVQNKKITLSFQDHFANLAQMAESLTFGATDNYKKSNLTYVDVPEIVGITGACENVDTLFKVQNNLDIPLFFTQTGQLALEQALQSFPGVFTTIHSGRDEEEEDARHLRQFRLTEEEFDCTLVGMTRKTYDEEKMFEAMLDHIQSSIQAMISRILEDNGSVLEKKYKRNIKKLIEVTKTDFLRISYENAVKLLKKNGFKEVEFGDDLESDHEAKIVELLNEKGGELPVFITKYPQEIKFFNMKVSGEDPRVVLSADLVLPYAGEAVGSAVREHDFKRLNQRLLDSTMFALHTQRGGKYEDFLWYLDIIKNKGTNPHAGYGVGNERVLQFVFGEKDIRHASLFSLLNRQSGDWSKDKYGQGALVRADKKHILLSIGKPRDKKFILPFVKNLIQCQPQYILHATGKTQKFLKQNDINANLVHKISDFDQTPNIAELLKQRLFDIVINTPTRTEIRMGKEFTDGKLIRKGAIQMGSHLITDLEVAGMVLGNLANGKAKERIGG